MRLKSGLRVFWRGPGEAQVGFDPRLALVVELSHPAEFEVLRMLESDQTPAGLRHTLEQAGAPSERADQLIRALAEAGLLESAPRSCSAELRVRPELRDLLAAEADSRSLVEANGWQRLARRQAQCVSVYGLGRTGALVALGLANAGVGHLQLCDPKPVAPRDRGPVFGHRDVGLPRADALAPRLRELGCATRVLGKWRRPHAAVLVDYEVADPNRSAFMARHGVPHLSVVVGELEIACGPWVGAGAGACLRCVRLWAAERDPAWPSLATQRFSRSAVAGRGEDPCLASTAAGLAVGQVLQGLAGDTPSTAGRAMTVALPAYSIGWSDVRPHPTCDHDVRGAQPRCGSTLPPPPLVQLPPAE
ncbi:MAG: ThiF family adenylyltransferase [Bifidobacteriaceae bacterium]|nr:ThiF family adenylyltransferase [Bifidobacteriaceae bacterium]